MAMPEAVQPYCYITILYGTIPLSGFMRGIISVVEFMGGGIGERRGGGAPASPPCKENIPAFTSL